MADALWTESPVDASRPHFEVVHSFFKQTAARFGFAPDSDRLAFEFLLRPDPQAEICRQEILANLRAKIASAGKEEEETRSNAKSRKRPELQETERALARLKSACSSPANLYTSTHWCLIVPDSATAF